MKPKVQPPLPDRVPVGLTLRGSDTKPLDQASATLTLDGGWTIGPSLGAFARFDIPPSRFSTGGSLTVTCKGYQSRTCRVMLPPKPTLGIRVDTGTADYETFDQECILQVAPPVPTLARLTINGAFFEAGGQPFTVIECSDFRLFARFLAGEDIGPMLEQRRSVGYNTVRVFGMCRNMWELTPQHHPRFYELLRAFVLKVNAAGLYVEYTVFPDCVLVMPDRHDQLVHWTTTCDVLRWLGVIVELQNEADQGPNGIDAQAFQRPFGLIGSHGSNGSQATPVRPWWDYETFHTNDAPEWHRKNSHNAMEFSEGTDGIAASHVPVIANENTRFPDKDSNLNHAFDAAAAGALLTAGGCFHSVAGKTSDLWSGLELAAAEQWAKGARSVDLSQQRQPYQHREDLEGPTDLRVYQRGSAIVRIRQ